MNFHGFGPFLDGFSTVDHYGSMLHIHYTIYSVEITMQTLLYSV